MQKRAETIVKKGTVITGRWQRQSYTIIRSIGSGMIGTVYLCHSQGKRYALKMGEHPTALVREVNILKKLNKVRNQRLGPFLFGVDDWQIGPQMTYPFYVMEYIDGIQLESYIKQQGSKQVYTILSQLLQQLDVLHKMGYVFGDLKNDNILINTKDKPKVRLIDVGGVTKMGQSIKEYSNFFDRGYWQLGTRRAQPSYDLFALVMIVLTIYYPKQFKRGKHPRQQLIKAVQSIPELRVFAPSMHKAINGSYNSAQTMRNDIESLVHKHKGQNTKHNEPLLPQAIIISFISIGLFLIDYLW